MREAMVKREITMLREVIDKLVPLLAGQGLKVTQRGMTAYVTPDPKTLKPAVVNIPNLPDDAPDDLVLAIQGFIDHEVGHVLFSDWSIPISIADQPQLKALCNIVEDPFVERKFGEKFPGAVHNIGRLHEFFVNRITLPALDKVKGDEEDEFRVLVVPLIRAWSGQKFFQDFIKPYMTHPLIAKFAAAVPEDVKARLPKIKNSVESLEVALILDEILHPKAETPDAPEIDEDGDDKTTSSGGAGAPSRAGEGESDPDATPERCSGEPSDSAEAGDGAGAEHESEGDADEDEGESDSSDDPDEVDADETEDGDEPSSDASGDPEAGEDVSDAGGDEESEGDAGAEDRSDDDGAEGDDLEDDVERAGEELLSGPPGGKGGDPTDAMFSRTIDLSESDTFEGAISERIGEDMADAMRDSDYTIYTRDFDKVEVLKVDRWQDKWLTTMDDKVAHMVGPMQKDIERMMAARAQVQRIPGYRSGKLHGAGLHRLATGDDRVFRRKHEIKAVATAVTLLVDNSGSMRAADKIGVAMAAAYALSSTLDRVRVPHEVLGFTTYDNHALYAETARIREEEKRMRRKYTRTEPIWMPIYKEFHERMVPPVRKRFAAAEHIVPLSQNIDGECIEIATMRLLRRSERRKVLIVLSDGSPACCSPYPAMIVRKTKEAVERAEKLGVETIGIGILDASVTHFYPKNIVLRDLAELPRTVMGELRKVLQAA